MAARLSIPTLCFQRESLPLVSLSLSHSHFLSLFPPWFVLVVPVIVYLRSKRVSRPPSPIRVAPAASFEPVPVVAENPLAILAEAPPAEDSALATPVPVGPSPAPVERRDSALRTVRLPPLRGVWWWWWCVCVVEVYVVGRIGGIFVCVCGCLCLCLGEGEG